MKKIILSACLLLLVCMTAAAQEQTPARYGTLRYDSLLHSLPEYGAMEVQLEQLRAKYESEVSYNEEGFKRMFADYLQGQKDFPQNILLKRQRDLQEEMEKSIAFRQEADSLLRAAETDMERPVRALLDAAIKAAGTERGYDCVVNLDSNTVPFLNPALTEDATPWVLQKIGILRNY